MCRRRGARARGDARERRGTGHRGRAPQGVGGALRGAPRASRIWATLARSPRSSSFSRTRTPWSGDKPCSRSAPLLDPSRHDGRAVEPLVSALHDPRSTTEEQELLARALGRTGSPRALGVLLPLVTSKSLALRIAALDALGTLGPAGQDRELLFALEDDNASVRLHAAMALSLAGGPDSVHTLLARLTQGATEDRTAIGLALSGALSRSREETAREIESLLIDSGAAVRDALIEGLGRMSGPTAGTVLGELLKHAPGDVRSKQDRRSAGGAPRTATGDHGAARRRRPQVARRRGVGQRHFGERRPRPAVGSLGPRASWATAISTSHATRPPPWLSWRMPRGTAVPSGARWLRCARPRRTPAPMYGLTPSQGSRSWVRAATEAPPSVALSSTTPLRPSAPPPLARSAGFRQGRGPVRETTSELSHAASPTTRAAWWRTLAEASGSVLSRARRLLVFVVPDGKSFPVPQAPYALLRADGFIRSGRADRRGAIFERALPKGEVTLLVPAALAP